MASALVLIVEDDQRNRKLLRDVLRASGYRTVEAQSGEDGLQLAAELAPDLIVMDYRLPGMDGIDAVGALKSSDDTRRIPVVAITASAMPEDRERMMAAGFRAYMPKPIRVQELLSLVSEVLGTR